MLLRTASLRPVQFVLLHSSHFLFILCFAVLGNFVHASDTNADAEQSLFIVHFETGVSWDESLKPHQQLKFKEHSENLNRLRKMKVITFGARYGDLGVIILKSDSMQHATALVESDPGVKSGIFDFRINRLAVFYPWLDESE